ncbi:hypothetical protein BE20_44165 [Sorangium cellulosum]|nr:hypothetical protein BE20_44165 [Sorangium cellulosum]
MLGASRGFRCAARRDGGEARRWPPAGGDPEGLPRRGRRELSSLDAGEAARHVRPATSLAHREPDAVPG